MGSVVVAQGPVVAFGRDFEEKVASELGAGAVVGKNDKQELKQVPKHLSPDQRQKLQKFLADRTIPKGFFDDEKSKLSIGQKLVLSAYMIARGEVEKDGAKLTRVAPRSDDSRHLLQLIYNYAGLAPERHPVMVPDEAGQEGTGDVRRSMEDPTGQVHFGAGTLESIRVGDGLLSPSLGDWLVLERDGKVTEMVMFAGWRTLRRFDIDPVGPMQAAVYRRAADGVAQLDLCWLRGRTGHKSAKVHIIHAIWRIRVPVSKDAGAMVPLDTDPKAHLGDAPAAVAARSKVQAAIDTTLATLRRHDLDPDGLAKALAARAKYLRQSLDLAGAERLDEIIAANSEPKVVSGNEKRVTVHQLMNLVAINQRLSFVPSSAITGVLDDAEVERLRAFVAQPGQGVKLRIDPIGAESFERREKARTLPSAFRAEFSAILGELTGEKEPADADVEALIARFSERQREQLRLFFRDRLVRPGLFTAEEKPNDLPLAQRTLIAAHLYTHGKIRAPSLWRGTDPETGRAIKVGDVIEQKPHADNCGDWVSRVWIYAGVNTAPERGTFAASPAGGGSAYRNLRDLTGQISIGTGSDAREGWVPSKDIDVDTMMGDFKDWWRRYRYQESVRGLPEYRRPGAKEVPKPESSRVPLTDIFRKGRLQVGDWLVVPSGNATGYHSVMFAGWVNGEPDPSARRWEARIFHQMANRPFGDPAGGGRFSSITLESPGYKSGVVYIGRVENVNPARTEHEVLPFSPDPEALKKLREAVESTKMSASQVHALLAKMVAKILDPSLAAVAEPQRKVLQKIAAENGPVEDVDPYRRMATLIAILERLRGRALKGVLDKSLLEALLAK
ncbi:MAG: hypothetical protein QM820_34195 [Minicystis sp.]